MDKKIEHMNNIKEWFDEPMSSGKTRFEILQTLNIDVMLENSKGQSSILEDKLQELDDIATNYETTLLTGIENARAMTTAFTENAIILKKRQDEWNALQTDFEEKIETYQTRHNTEIVTTKEKLAKLVYEIESIKTESSNVLNLATSAGLAKAYGVKIKNLTDSIKKQRNTFFYINITLTVIACIFAIVNITGFVLKWFDINDYQGFIGRFFMFGSMALPLIWIAKQNGELMRQNMHILEEYEHKKSLVDTYVGYKNDLISLTDSSEQSKLHVLDLIAATTKGIMKNPANTLPKNKFEKLPLEEAISTILDTSKILQEPLNILKQFNSTDKSE